MKVDSQNVNGFAIPVHAIICYHDTEAYMNICLVWFKDDGTLTATIKWCLQIKVSVNVKENVCQTSVISITIAVNRPKLLGMLYVNSGWSWNCPSLVSYCAV